MIVIIVTSVILLIVGIYYLNSYTIEKYNFKPLEFWDHFYAEILVLFFVLAAGIFNEFTSKRMGFININLNSFVLLCLTGIAFLYRVREIARQSSWILGFVFGLIRVSIAGIGAIALFFIFFSA